MVNNQLYPSENKIPETKNINKPKFDTGEYNLTQEEVAESVINSLDDAQKFLRGEVKLSKAREFIKQLKKEIEEEENG